MEITDQEIDYKPFFQLIEEPFNTVASPRVFFLSPSHAIALNKSVYTVNHRIDYRTENMC
jgi:hypothetical protein